MNPVALITGASRGIGRGIAEALAALGWNLALNFQSNSEAAQATAARCRELGNEKGMPIRAEICQADISQAADRERLIAFTRETFGSLHMLVNNAGVAPNVRADILEAGEASFQRLIDINVKGPYFLTQLAARWMIQQAQVSEVRNPPHGPLPSGGREREKTTASCPGSWSIVTISSVSAYAASTNRGEYCVSKAALSMLTPLYASRLAEYGIRVYEIRPGVIATDMTGPVKQKYDKLIAEGFTPIQRWGTPGDVGQAVAAIAEGRFPFSTGEVFNVDGGFHLRRL